MRSAIVTLIALCLCQATHADVFNLGSGLTNLEMVTVGDPGNAADTRKMNDGTTSYGSVPYTYNIGKYEVTAGQYCDFLNHKAKSDPYGLYIRYMTGIIQAGISGDYTYSVASDWANRPVVYVSFWSACRFANWLGNGQGDGDTENGAYTLDGYNGNDGRTIQRNDAWKWAVPSENEWYKAAYYKGNGADAGYWLYATSNNADPDRDTADASGNNANYYELNSYVVGSPYYVTEVGEFQNSRSPYGTFDQSGNAWEWNEAIVSASYRSTRGGCYFDYVPVLKATTRGFYESPQFHGAYTGFRVVQAVPEPSSLLPLIFGLGGLLGFRRKH